MPSADRSRTPDEWILLGYEAEQRARAARNAKRRAEAVTAATDAYAVAAGLGSSEAMVDLALLYKHQLYGVRKADASLVEAWYRAAAATDDGFGLFACGAYLMEMRKRREGLRLLRRAVKKGEGSAAAFLGNEAAAAGRASEALAWFERAVALRDTYGTFRAAELLEARGGKGDLERALRFYRVSARRSFQGASESVERCRSLLQRARRHGR